MNDYTEHAKLSPSGSKRWFACPGSLTLEQDFPNKSSTYSDAGTAMHAVAANVLTTAGATAAQWVGREVYVNTENEPVRTVTFDGDMAELVQGYVDSLRAIAGEDRLLVEQRVDFSEFVRVPGQFGTLDAGALFLAQGEIFVGDLKTGHTPVAVEKNSQLLIYALGFLRTLLDNDLATAHADPFEYARSLGVMSIRLGIYQPKINKGWTEWACSMGYLEEFATLARSKAASVIVAERMRESLPEREWEDTFLNSSPNAQDCAFCRAMPTCPSVQREIERVVGADFEKVPDHLQDAEARTSTAAKVLAQAMIVAPLVEDYFASVRAEVERRLLAGGKVPGFGLELGRRGARKFKDEVAAEELLRKVWRLSYDDVYKMSLKTPTQLEKLTKPTADAKALLGPRRWKLLEDMMEQAPPKPSVKPLSAIKTPYESASAEDFSTVVESDKP